MDALVAPLEKSGRARPRRDDAGGARVSPAARRRRLPGARRGEGGPRAVAGNAEPRDVRRDVPRSQRRRPPSCGGGERTPAAEGKAAESPPTRLPRRRGFVAGEKNANLESGGAFLLAPLDTALSPYLKFGCVSPRRHFTMSSARCSRGTRSTQPPTSLEGQLMWREFYYLVAEGTPSYDQMEGNPNLPPDPVGRRRSAPRRVEGGADGITRGSTRA